MMPNKHRWIAWSLAWMSLMLASSSLKAGIVMTGTRVVYAEQESGKSLHFENTSDLPYLLQIWSDSGDESSSQTDENQPFLAMPPLVSIKGKEGQDVRLRYRGGALPDDRESVFFLNFLQVPAMRASESNKNHLLLTVKSRMKIFYRPVALTGVSSVEEAMKRVTLHEEPCQGDTCLRLENASGYYLSLRRVTWSSEGRELRLDSDDMVAPLSDKRWRLSSPMAPDARLQITLIDDLGADRTFDLSID